MHSLPNAYAHMKEDLVWTKSKRALLPYTNYRHHQLEAPQNTSFLRSIIVILKLIRNWYRLFYKPKVIRLDGAAALLTRPVDGTFGHFVKEVMLSLYQFRLSGKQIDYYIIAQDYAFQKEMMPLVGIPESKIIAANPSKIIQATELLIPTILHDYSYVEYRPDNLHSSVTILTQVINSLLYSSLLINTLPKIPKRKIFLTRPKNSNRNIENASEVESLFKEFGFEIILPDSMSLNEQMELFSQAKVVASLHGSGFANILFAPRNIFVFELFSQYYHDPFSFLMALSRKDKYFYMIGETKDTTPHPQKENAYFEPNKLREALKILHEYIGE
ncbi:hypothetical protein BKN38_06245 [Helicobacter sp. CLO-3]|nr:hypothetical protein BA723_03665 [Helicobacter sp. CLO-3]OHU82804.1 hypothetical protein BKN38_06245 [Helicobacter sp. CLO-3]